MFDFAVILINYNSSKFTVDAVKSIVEKTSTKINYQIIVVDNASKEEDYNNLKNNLDTINFKDLTLFRSRINTGFGGGNMIGVQFANAKYYAFVNNDTLLKNDCLSIILNYFIENKKVALCAPQGFDENDDVLKSFDHFLTLRRELFGRKLFEKLNPKKYPKRDKVYENPIKVQCIPGSFLVVDAKSFDEVNGFDTNIFLYYEETDLAYRISKLKDRNECYLVPQAKYIHFQGKSTSKNILIKQELKLSLIYVLKKNSSYLSGLILQSIMLVKYFFKAIFKPSYFKLVGALLQGMPLYKSLKLKQKIVAK